MSAPFELHHLVKRGEFQRVFELLQAGASGSMERPLSTGWTRKACGKILSHDGKKETCTSNERSFVLDIKRLVWRTGT
jgi:hypothetical protein